MINSDGGMILGVFMVLVISDFYNGAGGGSEADPIQLKRFRRDKCAERNTNLRKILEKLGKLGKNL